VAVAARRPDDRESLVETWARLESRYSPGPYVGSPVPNELRTLEGSNGVVITAPHAVGHYRDGVRKGADRFTGSLAEVLAAASGSSALVLAGSGPGDPNWDAAHPFKDALLGLLARNAVVLDLHGMRDSYGCDVCVGRGMLPDASDSAEAARVVVDRCGSAGLTVWVDRPFDARRAETVTSFVQAQGGASAQIEIAARFRSPRAEPEPSGRMLDALLSAIAGLAG
jgi:hypothetical protein